MQLGMIGLGRMGANMADVTEMWRRGNDDYADRVLSAMRFGFGGYLEKPVGGKGS